MKKRNWNLRIGCCITGVLVLMIIVGIFWTPYEPNAMSSADKQMAPCLAHLFGTDQFGRDIFSRVLEGGRTSLLIAVCTVGIILVGYLFNAMEYLLI